MKYRVAVQKELFRRLQEKAPPGSDPHRTVPVVTAEFLGDLLEALEGCKALTPYHIQELLGYNR